MARTLELCFQCPRCGLGDFEVGHLMRLPADGPFCLVCQEEDDEVVRLQTWDRTKPTDQAMFLVDLSG
jgi:hypothetical protein